MRISDWSSDVCSSDLERRPMVVPRVKIQIVDNRANPNTVKDVAQGAPDYGSEGQRLRPRASPPKPHSKQHDDTRHDSRQDQGAAGEPTREHPERHAFIEAEPHIEKWGDGYRHAGDRKSTRLNSSH